MFRSFAALLTCALVLAGCTGGAPKRTGSTPQKGLEAFIGRQVTVFQEVAAGEDRILMHQQPGHPAPTAVLMVKDQWGRWEVSGGWGFSPLRDMGPVSLEVNTIGKVEEQHGQVTVTRGKIFAVYGVVNDPRITWVEVTLQEDGGRTNRATVVNGTWVAWFLRSTGPMNPPFAIRGGAGDQELFNIPDGWKRSQ